MALRCHFEHSTDIGVYARITNKYALVAYSSMPNFYELFEAHLSEYMPVIRATIGGARCVGRVCVGNKNGLLVSSQATDQELMHIRNSLPDDIVIRRVDERLCALGNVISCNDHVALLHPSVSKETEEAVQDVLGVDTIRRTIAGESLVGSCCVMTGVGCLVHPLTPREEQAEISGLIGVPVCAGTVGRGGMLIGGGICVNDWAGFVGSDSTPAECSVIETIFGLRSTGTSFGMEGLEEIL